jgi:capsular polysaccharide biosynthesis protein
LPEIAAARHIAATMQVFFQYDSQSIYIQCRSGNQELAAACVNAYASAIVDYYPAKRQQVISLLRDFYTSRIEESSHTRADVQKALEYLDHFEAIPALQFEISRLHEAPSYLIYPNRNTNRSVGLSLGLLIGVAIVLLTETYNLEKRTTICHDTAAPSVAPPE